MLILWVTMCPGHLYISSPASFVLSKLDKLGINMDMNFRIKETCYGSGRKCRPSKSKHIQHLTSWVGPATTWRFKGRVHGKNSMHVNIP